MVSHSAEVVSHPLVIRPSTGSAVVYSSLGAVGVKLSGGGIVKVNKYLYLWIVQGHYGSQYGWEDLCASENYKEARANLKDYRVNELGVAHRMIQRRELNSREVG